MKTSLLGGIALAALAVCSSVPSQARARPAAPPVPATMLATERFLFVVRGDVLYQFDVTTLELLNQHRFAGPGRAAGAPAAPRVVDVREVPGVSTIVEVVEPPPPPPRPRGIDASVEGGLAWLASHQDDDGRWDSDGFMKHDQGEPCDGAGNAVHDVGVTSLATLALMGYGNTMRTGPYRDHVKRAVAWLRTQQQENGLIGTNASHDFIYDHALATLALSEAYGLSNHEALKPVVQHAVDYLESHRNPYAVWRYQPRDNDNDTSVTTWAVCALVSAKSNGIKVNPLSLQMAASWYDEVTAKNGRVGYTKRGESSSRMPGDHARRFPVDNFETLTAAGTFARLLLGESPETKPVLKDSVALLMEKPPRWKPGFVDSIYWYFGAAATYQLGGQAWKAWRPALAKLASHQRKDGAAKGSWDVVGVWDESGGRVFVTALNTLTLATVARSNQLIR